MNRSCNPSLVLVAGYIVLAAAAVLGAEPAAADTETRPVEVQFEAPDGCSGPDAFFNTLQSRTGRIRRSDAAETHATVRVRLVRAHGHIVGELAILDDHGGTDIRRVQGANCNDVVQALSLTAALALDPNALLSAPATTAAQATTMAPASVGEAAATGMQSSSNRPAAPLPSATADQPTIESPRTGAPAPTQQPPRERWDTVKAASTPTATSVRSFEVAVHTLGVGLLSGDLSPGFMLTARRVLAGDGALRPTLGLAIAYARNDLLHATSTAQVSLASLAGVVCPLGWTANIFTLRTCAVLLAGRLSAGGRQVSHSYQVEHLWLSAGAGFQTAAYLGRGVSLELEAAFHVPFFHREFYATVPANVVAETPAVSPLVGVGLTYGL